MYRCVVLREGMLLLFRECTRPTGFDVQDHVRGLQLKPQLCAESMLPRNIPSETRSQRLRQSPPDYWSLVAG